MKVTRISKISGVKRTRDLPITKKQYARFKARKETIQAIFPKLSPEDREFIKTGITDEEWKDTFGR